MSLSFLCIRESLLPFFPILPPSPPPFLLAPGFSILFNVLSVYTLPSLLLLALMYRRQYLRPLGMRTSLSVDARHTVSLEDAVHVLEAGMHATGDAEQPSTFGRIPEAGQDPGDESDGEAEGGVEGAAVANPTTPASAVGAGTGGAGLPDDFHQSLHAGLVRSPRMTASHALPSCPDLVIDEAMCAPPWVLASVRLYLDKVALPLATQRAAALRGAVESLLRRTKSSVRSQASLGWQQQMAEFHALQQTASQIMAEEER